MAMAALLPVFSRLLLSSGKCGDNNTISGESVSILYHYLLFFKLRTV